VGYSLSGLAAPTATGVITTNTVCTGAVVTTTSYVTNIVENFATAFKTAADETLDATAATSGTRFAVTFANVAPNTLVYVPLAVQAANGAIIKAVTSATGALALATDAGLKTEPTPPAVYSPFVVLPANLVANGIVNVPIANATGTVYYEVTTDNLGSLDTFPISVYLATTAGSLTSPATAMTSAVSFAPIGSATNYPNFANANLAAASGSAFGACNTTLLFPYVTNTGGFETGLVVSNTSLDNFGAKGVSQAQTQTGTCALNFYGSATNPAAYTTPSIAGGTAWVNTLTVAAGANFVGYAIANCNFQFAHGFAYIVYQFGAPTEMAMGYLAEVFGAGARAATEALNN